MAGLHISPAMIEGAYELLRTTPPFRGWKLPHADDVTFVVLRKRRPFADTHFDRKKGFMVRVSHTAHTQLSTLLATVAHEMIHIRQGQLGQWHGPDHGALFNKLADQVCWYHHFDRGAF